MGLVIFTPATAMEVMTDFPLWVSVVITGTVATVYTTLVSIQHQSIVCGTEREDVFSVNG